MYRGGGQAEAQRRQPKLAPIAKRKSQLNAYIPPAAITSENQTQHSMTARLHAAGTSMGTGQISSITAQTDSLLATGAVLSGAK